MSRRKSSIHSINDKKDNVKEQDQDTLEIPIKKKVKIQPKVTIKIPFADILSSDNDSSDSSQILTGIHTKYIHDVPDFDSPIYKKETKEDSQLF